MKSKTLKPTKGRILKLIQPITFFGTTYLSGSTWVVEKGGKSPLISPINTIEKVISYLALEILLDNLNEYFEVTGEVWCEPASLSQGKQVHCFSSIKGYRD
ncbi:TPA: hypothetical protein MW242_002911 [Acinetobacter baumannii]|nr:hypothetical protein [Acinetobacter baumannii]